MENVQRKQELENSKVNPYVENCVKSNLEIIVLSMLSEKAMCGYDLIKVIFADYDVYLSQGTLYPLLYSLKEKGIVQANFAKTDMRTKRYFITSKGKQIVEKKMDDFYEAEMSVMNLIKR